MTENQPQLYSIYTQATYKSYIIECHCSSAFAVANDHKHCTT